MQTNPENCGLEINIYGWLCFLIFVAYLTGTRIRIKTESFTRLRTFVTLKRKLIHVPGHKCYVRATEEFNREY